ncbi:hypothetical protein FACS18942_00670 [Planctomycetales bacterium]|nr:hypothetical protein FACS18942_00670 [Planctomycetales bacterium]GHT34600.1 hypothetical protein FACS189427_02180 [Planctomycetales bacterium]
MKNFYVILFAVFCITALTAAQCTADTVFIGDLDLSKTTCGWQKTQKNKSVGGHPLSIGGEKFQRGVGHHAPGEILFNLPQSKGTFTAWVGIDDETGKQGHAEFLVFIDGKQVWRSGFITGGQKAKRCEVPFEANNRQMQLSVDTGPEGYGHDHTDWAEASITFEHNGFSSISTMLPKIIIKDNEGNIIERNDETGCQYAALQQELTKGIDPRRAAQALRPESAFLPSDKTPFDVVLRRTQALLEHLKTLPGAPDFTAEEAELKKLSVSGAAFADIAALRDKIALKNPLLNFQNIIFIKRHYNPEPEKQGNHMVDQFFGFHAVSGGGLFVLENAFEPEKRTVKNLLQNTKLDSNWGYLSPELSYDCTKILFAAADTSEQRHSYQWTEGNAYHLFSVNIDGTDLQQLTFGDKDDIDPCFLPNGRIAFISERRGGFGRCHARPCPSYTLFSMEADGSGITMLSPHETNEWSPVVDNNGMIVYTRWDYVDRGFNQAHHPWITFPDGRDPRAIQGNYSERQYSDGNGLARPHFETSFQPVPNSQKLVGTAQGHHTQYFGSIIMLDPTAPDDEEGADSMNSLKRITPEQLFPEAECAPHKDASNYGQPFPLNEDFYLVVYDAFSGMGKGHLNNYGIYLLDSFGNKTLLYRDPEISCQVPIPVKVRPRPPVIPNQTFVGLPEGQSLPNNLPKDENGKPVLPKTATAGVINVYEANRPLPADTEIKELRIVQVLPKTTYNANTPWIGYGNETGARKVLGTVPVNKDGSVRFELPVDVPVYFQILDKDGVAVQTMRSATYIKPGETLTCTGCHEGRHRSIAGNTKFPAAFRSAPSVIKPEMTGSNPFNYPLLVQTVWDKHCVECHNKEAENGKTFRLGRGEIKKENVPDEINLSLHFFESYRNLRPYVFVFKGVNQKQSPELMNPLPSNGGAWNPWTTSRTFPGKFGANASPLWNLLKKGHYNVSLSEQELRAVALWLDNNADFYGAFELETLAAQRNGEVVKPALE